MSILKHKTAAFDTDVAFATSVTMGLLADEGTDVGDPEIQTETIGGGAQAAVGATLNFTLRAMGNGGAWLATLQGYAADLTQVYVRIFGADGTSYTQYGPCNVVSAYVKGRTSEGRRNSVIAQFGMSADFPSQFLSNGT